MKILVFSDSHAHGSYISDALHDHPGADAVIFLGDGIHDAESALRLSDVMQTVLVRGNCDTFSPFGADYPEEMLLDFGGVRFFILHGHTCGVKSGMERLLYRAVERQADAVLYGHTHIPQNEFVSGWQTGGRRILLFNPGSVGLSHYHPYGVIRIEGGKILASHESATHGNVHFL